jgi:hypothetical protein
MVTGQGTIPVLGLGEYRLQSHHVHEARYALAQV